MGDGMASVRRQAAGISSYLFLQQFMHLVVLVLLADAHQTTHLSINDEDECPTSSKHVLKVKYLHLDLTRDVPYLGGGGGDGTHTSDCAQ